MTSRFFLENSQEFLSGNKISKKNNPDVFHHLKDVLRVKDKDLVELVAGQSAYLVRVNEISAMEVFFNRLDKLSKDPEIPVKTTIVVPLLKSDHLDWLIQKATELGVFKIDLKKDNDLSEDSRHRTEDDIQKATDLEIKDIDRIADIKEKELMEI